MNSKRRKAILVFMAAVMALGFQAMPIYDHFGSGNVVYGDTMLINSKVVGSASAMQGDQNVVVTIEVENRENGNFTFDSATLELSTTKDVTISGGSTGTITLTKGQKASISFYLNVSRFAVSGSRTMSLILRNDGSTVHEGGSLGRFTIYDKIADPSGGAGTYTAVLDITHYTNPEGGFDSGQDNTLILDIINNGNTVIKNAELTLTMPDGLSLNNASNSMAMGYISTGSRKEVSFPIAVDDDAESKNYAIAVELTGLSFNNSAVSLKKTFYVPVNGSGTSIKNAEITNISTPSQVYGEEEFTLSFDVENRNSADLKNVRVNVDIPEGLLNKSRSTFIEASIPAGSSKNYSVTLFAADGAKEKAYSMKISLSSSASTEDPNTVTQYASVYVSGVAGAKTPQLMVDNYSYGGTHVQAGDEFLLELGLYNTSGTHTISNIKVTVSSEDGVIIPVNSSNSFYIDKLGKKERTGEALYLSVKPDAEQKTTPLTIEMSYEDGSGNAFTSKDIISIPVMQETKLEVDDIIAPPELYAGMQSGVSVQFYNTGKTTLNNLRVTAEGDFDTPESTSYFVGNMESGKSDTYDFGFIPRKGGNLEGKIIFSYEDASGDVQILERPFSFQVMDEMPVFDEGMPMDKGDGAAGGSKILWIVLGILALLTGGGIFAWKKIRKKKRNQEMEIDD
ncbi:MAG TPA: hypothetical protein VEA58_13585 [Anaerovoracaceae bacterium]|nr:hypothetical protein [Anaerovoracaceae bacterium]